MADVLEILVKSLGVESLDELKKKVDAGNISLKEMTQAKKAVNAAFQDTDLKSKEHAELAGVLATINDRQRDVRIVTKAGHEAYFKAGLEVRQLALAGGLLNNQLGKLSDQLGNSVLNAVQLKQALIPLGVQMTGVGIGIAAIVSAAPFLVNWFMHIGDEAKKQAANVKKMREEIEKVTLGASARAAARLGERDSAKAIQFIDLRVAKLKEAIEAEYGPDGKALEGARQRNFEREKEINNLLDERINQLGKIKEAQEKIVSDIMGGRIRDIGFGATMLNIPRPVPRFTLARGKETFFGTTGKLPSMWGSGKIISEGIDEAQPKVSELTNTLKAGAQSFTSTLLMGLVQGRDLAQSLVDVLLSIGINVATAGIGNLLGFQHGGIISEPVVGRGMRSGSFYTFAERGPEYVVPTGGGGGMTPFVTVIPLIDNAGLAVKVEVGNRINRRRRY